MSEKSLADRMKLSWKRMPIAGNIFQSGSASEYRTGDWRVKTKPMIDNEKCIMCLFCWIFCPDIAIIRTDEAVDVDYEHCKGCGICSVECPVNAINMVEE